MNQETYREPEAYQVPMTDEDVALAEARMQGFSKGYYAGIMQSVNVLLGLHQDHKEKHNHYLVSANYLRDILKKLKEQQQQ